MNEHAFNKIKALLDASKVPYQVYTHEICRTSQESSRARKAAGMPEAMGAKALLCKVEFQIQNKVQNEIRPGSNADLSDSSERGINGSQVQITASNGYRWVDFLNDNSSEFMVFVLPGTHILDKAGIKAGILGFKQFRFATPQELVDIAGVVPGCMPPFGSQVFPKVARIYIAAQLAMFERVAFNAAKLDTSITLLTTDYLKIVQPDKVFDFSKPKE